MRGGRMLLYAETSSPWNSTRELEVLNLYSGRINDPFPVVSLKKLKNLSITNVRVASVSCADMCAMRKYCERQSASQ